MAGIELKNIVKEYGDGFLAVDDVSLSIAEGEFMILVGPSGCGKSTLLRMIVGLEDITSGDMVIDGDRVNDKAPRDRNLAMVFQNYALYPHLTVFENIAFPLRLAKLSDSEVREKVEAAADTLELKEHLQRKPANLSGGQRQRVAMGRAIVRDAKAFLFDEPLSNLDAKLRGQMRTEISRLQKRMGTTTVYVTHDQTEAMTLGDRVAVLRKGVLQQCDTPRELYENPVNLFVAGFIGAPPMNFLPAAVKNGQVELPFCTLPLPPDVNAEEVEGKLLVAGVRPEFFNDASFVDDAKRGTGQTFQATVDVTEWLGNEQYAYVPYDSPAEIRAELDVLAADLDMEAMRPQLIISLDPASRVEEGSPTEFWVDATKMHLFDPSSGKNLALADLDLTPNDEASDESGADSGGPGDGADDAVVAADVPADVPADADEPATDSSTSDAPPPGQEDEPVDASTDSDGDEDTAEPSAAKVEAGGGPIDPEETAAEGESASVEDEDSGPEEGERPNAEDTEKRSGG